MTENEKYMQALANAMWWFSHQPNTIIMGQAVEYPGTGCYESLHCVPANKKLELPVVENFQVGLATGMALTGMVPLVIIPRWNFLLSAADQLVNHLDKLGSMSDQQYQPKVIIRVAVGSEIPIDPQDQHRGNFSSAFKSMLTSIDVVELTTTASIMPAYQHAYTRTDGVSSILVEFPDHGKSA